MSDPKLFVDKEEMKRLINDQQLEIQRLSQVIDDLKSNQNNAMADARARDFADGLGVTSKMKAAVHGEYFVDVTVLCSECLGIDEDPDCEICKGDGNYAQQVMVPWTMCKDIYKSMLSAAEVKP